MWLTREDLARREKAVPEDFAQKAAELSDQYKKEVKESFDQVLAETRSLGFDWKNAILQEVTVDHESGFLPDGRAMEADIYLHIESGEKTIVIMLDECFLVEGIRRTPDGFRLMP